MRDVGGPPHPSSLPGGGGCCRETAKQESLPPFVGNVSAITEKSHAYI